MQGHSAWTSAAFQALPTLMNSFSLFGGLTTTNPALVLGAARISVAGDSAALIASSSFDDQSQACFGAYQCSRELRTFPRFAYCLRVHLCRIQCMDPLGHRLC